MILKERRKMIMPNILISLSDNDKRLIFSLLLIFIIVVVLIGLLGYILFRLMKWQSKKMDTLVHDVVIYKVVTDKKHFIRYGRYKNWALFFKQACIPLAIILVAFIVLIIHNSITNNWSYNPFSTYDGFGTVFYTWKYSGNYVGGTLIKFAELVIDNVPHLVDKAWAGYIFGPLIIVGGVWYLIVAACLLARTTLLYRRSREVFEKSLDGYRQNEANESSKETEEEK